MNLIITNQQSKPLSVEMEETLRRAVLTSLALEGQSAQVEIGLTLVSDQTIRHYNHSFRDKDAVTDVLSFAMRDHVAEEPGAAQPPAPDLVELLGDIVIAYDRALEQAKRFDHSLRRELAYLTVHGLLHLLGYDHENEGDKRVMRGREEAILKELGLEQMP